MADVQAEPLDLDRERLIAKCLEATVRSHFDAMQAAGITAVPYEQISDRTKRVVENQVRDVVTWAVDAVLPELEAQRAVTADPKLLDLLAYVSDHGGGERYPAGDCPDRTVHGRCPSCDALDIATNLRALASHDGKDGQK